MCLWSPRFRKIALAAALAILPCHGDILLSGADQSARSSHATAAHTRPAEARVEAQDVDYVVRLFYQDRDRLGHLVSGYDVFGPANHDAGYVMARLRLAECQELQEAGYRLDIDEGLTAQANARLQRAPAQSAGIPGLPCYRTVEETLDTLARIAAQRSDLASLIDVGDSWEKAHSGGHQGYDLLVLMLSNKARPGPKPRFFLMAEHHARELATAETATRFAEELVAQYGTDPEVTWLLDYAEVHILPMANPDGRKWAERGHWWRKNTNDTNGCAAFPSYGTDLNRNCDFAWGGIGSSDGPCNEVYRGPSPFSEPENQAIRDYLRSLFPDQRGPLDNDPAPATATGLVISLHSYGQLVLFPWGWTPDAAPNHDALRTLGGKFGFFNGYTVQPSNQLYPTTGTADDWAYGELGVPTFTFELGNFFFESCSNFESQIHPANRLALLYAVKACRQPYLTPSGPDIVQPSVSPAMAQAGTLIDLTALADTTRSRGSTPPPPGQTIAAARYSLDAPSWTDGVQTRGLDADDTRFDSATERVRTLIDTTGWAPGRHTLFIEAQDAAGNWGAPTALFLWIEPLTLTSLVRPNGFAIEWASVSNAFYTVLRWDAIGATPFVVERNLPATPPTNSLTDPIVTGARLYRVLIEP